MLIKDIIFDAISGICFLAFFCYLIYTANYIVRAKELEFNRIWRTRLGIIIVAMFYGLTICALNLRVIYQFIPKVDYRHYYCGSVGGIANGFLLPFILFTVMRLIKLATNINALDSGNPNRNVFSVVFASLILPFLIAVANVVVIVFKPNLIALKVESDNLDTCVLSNVLSSTETIVSIIVMIVMLCIKDENDTLGINIILKQRVKKIPLYTLIFVFAGLICEAQPFFKDWALYIFQFVPMILNYAGIIVFINELCISPVKEAEECPILRGHITERHHKMFDEEDIVAV